jgi:hypothetical protein
MKDQTFGAVQAEASMKIKAAARLAAQRTVNSIGGSDSCDEHKNM